MNQELKPRADPTRAGASVPLRAEPAPVIIVPLDGSAHATAAMPVAKALADLDGATLHFVHVAEPIIPPRELLEMVGLTSEQLHGSVIEQAAGAPAASIVRLAREWQGAPIVMCSHTALARSRGAIGTVAEGVLREAPGPVVLVPPRRGPRPWTLRRIVLPHDGTPTTVAAMEPAADLAQRSGAELEVVHVAAPAAPRSNAPGTLTVPRYVDHPQHEWPQWAREFLGRAQGLCHHPPSVRPRLFMRVGEPAAEILRFASESESDLIALAWRGYLEPERATTLKDVIRDAPCPVIVYRVDA